MLPNLTNGDAAERLVRKTISRLGYGASLAGMSSEDVLAILPAHTHVQRAIEWLWKRGAWETTPAEASVSTLIDYALGVDALLEGVDGELISVDVTISEDKLDHKVDVHRLARAAKRKLHIHHHIILVLSTTETYETMSMAQRWQIMDALLEARAEGTCSIVRLAVIS